MILNCARCNSQFEPKFWVSTRPMPKYCTRRCMATAFSRYPIVRICSTCNKEFNFYGGSKGKFCSVRCIHHDPKALLNYNKANPKVSFWKNATHSEKLERYKRLFEERVIRNEGCWGWKSYIDSTGSGQIGPNGKLISAYRASWLIHRGEIPDGLLVLHKCHNRICSNPDHLYIGTNKDNTRDMIEAGRRVNSRQNSKLAKLDKDKAFEIKELLKNKSMSQNKIAKKFGVCRGTILDILNERSWKDV